MRVQSFSRIYLYGAWLMGGFLLWLFSKNGLLSSPLVFSLGFLYILFLPGFSLGRFLKLEDLSFSGKILLYFVLGLGFYFIINLSAIILGISLSILMPVLIVLLILLFLGSFLCDFLKRDPQTGRKIEFNFHPSNLLYLLAAAVALFILWIVYLKGPSLNGDPYFHLAILRKALEGDSLSVRNLAFTKTLMINPTYVYPVWQVFLAFLSRLFSLDIFVVWHNIIFVLTIISFFAWYYLAQVIFEKKFLALLGLLLWMILTFYDGAGYMFTRLGVPDTLAQLILLPLGIAFTFKYVFKKESQKLLIVNFLIALMLLVLHGPHYFYLLAAVLAFGLFYAIFYFKSDDYKLILKRLLQVFLVELLVLVLVGIVLELRSRTISTTILEFNKSTGAAIAYSSFFKFSLVYKYGFFLLPLVLVWRKTRWWLVGVCMLLVPLVYFTPLRDFLTKFLSIVFTDRLLTNLAWYFFVFSAVLAVKLYLIDLFLGHFNKNIRLMINLLLLLIFGGLVFWETKSQIISDFIYKIFYAKPTDAFVNAHYLWFFLIPLFLAAVLLSRRLIWKRSQLLTLSEEPKNHLTMFLLVLIISFALISPSIVNVRYFLKQPKTPQDQAYFLVSIQNDQSALNYLKNRIPQKSVVLASGGASKGLSALTPQYMAYNAGSAYEKKFQWVFDAGTQDSAKAEIVTSPQWAIDYVYLDRPSLQNNHFRLHPEIYQKVYYSNKTEIYKVIK